MRVAAVALLLGACGGGDWSGGIHARMGFSDDGLRVVEVPEGPAREAGLRPDDRIVAIDGTPIIGRPIEQVVEMLRGPVGTDVELTVVRETGRTALTVERAPYDGE